MERNDSLNPNQRLIIAADFEPEEKQAPLRSRIIALAHDLKQLGVVIKLNSGLRALGYSFLNSIHEYGLGVFADLKFHDIPQTLRTDGKLLRPYHPDMVTVMCGAGKDAINALQDALPDTEILGVTVLTSIDDACSQEVYAGDVRSTVLRLVAYIIKHTGVRSFVCSPAEIQMLRQEFGEDIRLITPAIRPAWSIVESDDQNPDRIMTPAKAIAAGATRIVVGRPIIRAESPHGAAVRTILEIG